MFNIFFRKPFHVRGNGEKFGAARQATDEDKMRCKKMRYACRVIKARIQTNTNNP
jgi:hypothetical protein